MLGFFVASFLVSAFFSALYSVSFFGGFSINITTDIYYLLSGLLTVLSLGVPFYLFVVFKKNKFCMLLDFEPIPFSHALMYVICGWGLCLASNIPVNVIYTFISDAGVDAGVAVNPGADSTLSFVLKIIAVGVAPAVFEEFVFRGVIFSKLKKYGTSFALIASSLLFAMLHSNLVSMPFAFLAGLIIGFIYIRTGNLWIAIVIHFLNNTFSVIQEEVLSVFTGEMAIAAFNIIFYVVVALAFLIVAWLEMKCKISNNLVNQLSFIKLRTKFFALITNPSMIIFFILCISSILANVSF